MTDTLRVMVVDDTVTYRKIMEQVVNLLPDADVIATAPNGRLALAKLEHLKVDVILLDVEMPEMDGLETLEVLQRDYPRVTAIMVSGATRTAANLTIRALQAGALDVVPKPETSDPNESISNLVGALGPLFRAIQTQLSLASISSGAAVTETAAATSAPEPVEVPESPPQPPPPTTAKTFTGVPELLVIGCSTGGPDALGHLIPQLPGDLGVPVLIVQHMPPMFTQSLAESLNHRSALTVKEAEADEAIVAGTVYIAPGGHHMVIRKGTEGLLVGINDSPPVNSCRPAVDVLFRSVATVFTGPVAAVVLTGMGEDGCQGVRSLKRKQCSCFTQTAGSCVVYGMPRAVDEAGLSDRQVPLHEMATELTQLFQGLSLAAV